VVIVVLQTRFANRSLAAPRTLTRSARTAAARPLLDMKTRDPRLASAALRRALFSTRHFQEAIMAQHPAHAQDHRHPGQPSPIAIQKALHGVGYPATREHLVEAARGHQADEEIVALISRLPDKHYDSPAAVSKEIARIQ
jgi:hypothetical protein